jgi:pimeloyl-ACP methyl ester carboxylesterase
VWGYAIALVASWCYQGAVALRDDATGGANARVAGANAAQLVSSRDADSGATTVYPYQGPLAQVPVRVAWKAWRADANLARPPVVLIHGAPGGKEDWDKLAPLLATNRDVYAIDLPGFGASSVRVPDHSVRAGAAALRAWMDANQIDRAHVVGWSNGGGVALHVAHEAPARVASLTLLASIGEQRFEGSGSHLIEHARYGLGMLVLGPGLDLLPHFGVLGTRDERTGWIRSFSQSDQRPFERLMREIASAGRPPTLILHGRSDFLVPVRTAISAHERIEGSRLVLMDASHFIPFMQEDAAANLLTTFFAATDDATGAGLASAMAQGGSTWLQAGSRTELDPPTRSPMQRAAEPVREVIRGASPWVLIGAIAVLAFFAPAFAAACATMLMLGLDLDYLVAILGVFVGLLGRDVITTLWARRAHAEDASHRPPTAIERRLRLVPGSKADWQQRLTRAPFSESWTACLMRDLRESSVAAAARASATPHQRAMFAIGRLVGNAIVAVVSVMGGVIVGAILVIMLGGHAHAAFTREDLDIALLWAPMLALLLVCARGLPLLLSRRGRTRLYVFVRRCLHHEFWQSFWFYVPFWPVYAYLMVKHRGLLVWTCCNPGIGEGGGIVGEGKTECFQRFGVANLADEAGRATAPAFDPDAVGIWPYATIPAGPAPAQRAAMAIELLAREPRLGGYPIVLKPDSGLRGFGFKLVRTPEQLARYFENVSAAVLMQRYHAGPLECSVLWCRSLPSGSRGEQIGTVYSITAKQFQVLEGDGVRTLEQLIDRDRRARLQRDTFRERHADRLAWIPAKGERITLNVAGNHCQGTIFRDAEELRSPALEAAIDRFCATYHDGGIDLVRLDIRYESPEQVREGRGLAIVDVNGTMGESVNMYDPDHAYPWALRVLSGHWSHMFAIGAWRRAQGVKPLSLIELVRLRGFYEEHHGNRVSD